MSSLTRNQFLTLFLGGTGPRAAYFLLYLDRLSV